MISIFIFQPSAISITWTNENFGKFVVSPKKVSQFIFVILFYFVYIFTTNSLDFGLIVSSTVYHFFDIA